MKHLLAVLFCLLTVHAFSHEGVDLGPDGGRLLVIDKKTSLYGEVVVKDDRFHLTLLDSRKKPLAVSTQTLGASCRSGIVSSTKLAVARTSHGFIFPLVRGGSWIVLQYRPSPEAKPVTARFSYDVGICSGCGKAEWLCGCQ